MNLITIKDNGEFFYTTPDTSLNRDSKDYFCPESIDKFAVVCFYYVRIEKNAKAVTEKYANRYISGFGYGIKMEAVNIGGEDNPYMYSMSSALDNTAYISPCITQEEFTGLKPNFKIDNIDIAPNDIISAGSVISSYQKVIANITSISTLRSGDIILFEADTKDNHKHFIKRDKKQEGCYSKISFGDIKITINW